MWEGDQEKRGVRGVKNEERKTEMWEGDQEKKGVRGVKSEERKTEMWEGDQEKRGVRGVKSEGQENKEQSWQFGADAPSDLLVRVADVDFRVHKFPLLSRSGKLSRLFHDRSPSASSDQILLPDLPGGPPAFSLAAKFCYGLPVDLSAATIAPLRCAAEFLEMTEDLEQGNLIFKTEAFLSYVVLSSWRDSLLVLRSCETLTPWAENLQIVRRCSESLAWKTFSDSISSWIEDLSSLRIDHFIRVLTAMKAKGIKPNLLGSAIMFYAERWIQSEEGIRIVVSGGEKRIVIESLISIIPHEKDCVSCGFLLKMVRLGGMLAVSQALMGELEKRAGMQLEQAELGDLLIPAYGGAAETMYDVDLVGRLVEQFLLHDQDEGSGAKTRVARLLDSYLTEVARDRNLSPSKFQVLAEALPETARISDDGLYRAIDSYLKSHPAMTEHERKRLCRVMDCQKLSMDACMHAAQNERLPLRIALHILFSEQLRLGSAIVDGDMPPRRPPLSDDWTSAKQEIAALKFELSAMKVKYTELQAGLEGLQRQLERGSGRHNKSPPVSSSGWTSGWKKFSRLNKKADGRAIAVVQQPVELPATAPRIKGQRRWRNSIS